MAKDFDGSTSIITTSLTTHNSTRSYGIWTYREGAGEATFGRMFDKSAVERLINDQDGVSPDGYSFSRVFSGGTADWVIAAPSLNVWHHVLVTYDSSSATNDPIFYIDGISQSLTGDSNTTGTANTNTEPYIIGNRGDVARTWDGRLCEFAIWNRILTAAEVASIGGDSFSALFYPDSLIFYAPLIREAIDIKGTGSLTDTATSVIAHPRIIYPQGSF